MEMDHKRELADTGFTVLEDYMGAALLNNMRVRVDELLEEEGAAAGSEFKTEENARRLANLVDKGEVFREAISGPELLALVESVLGDGFKLSSLNMRSANPHSSSVQPFHIDMGLLPDEKGYAGFETGLLVFGSGAVVRRGRQGAAGEDHRDTARRGQECPSKFFH